MNVDAYTLLVFLHVLLFAYWLGPDWGVFVSARRAANEALSREQRLQYLATSVEIDVVPRTAIVLIIAVGFTLSYLSGFANVGAGFVWAWWLLSVVWLALVWLTGYLLDRRSAARPSRFDSHVAASRDYAVRDRIRRVVAGDRLAGRGSLAGRQAHARRRAADRREHIARHRRGMGARADRAASRCGSSRRPARSRARIRSRENSPTSSGERRSRSHFSASRSRSDP